MPEHQKKPEAQMLEYRKKPRRAQKKPKLDEYLQQRQMKPEKQQKKDMSKVRNGSNSKGT